MISLLFKFSSCMPDGNSGNRAFKEEYELVYTNTTCGCQHPLFSLPEIACMPSSTNHQVLQYLKSRLTEIFKIYQDVHYVISLLAKTLDLSKQSLVAVYICCVDLVYSYAAHAPYEPLALLIMISKETCLKQIATGRLTATEESFYAITCPGLFFHNWVSSIHVIMDFDKAPGCNQVLLGDAYAIKQVVPSEFYEVPTCYR